METYEKLLEKTKEILQFQTGLDIIRWDLQTHMPPRGMKQRSQQLALMSKILHRMTTDNEIDHLITKLEKNIDDLEPVQRREVQLVRRKFNRSVKIPEDLVARWSIQRTVTVASWAKAKESDNWKMFESELGTFLDISHNVSEIIMDSIGAKCKLDAEMDIYEPRMTVESISKVFKELRKRLIPLVQKYSAICEGISSDFKNRKVPIRIQKKLVADLSGVVGYDTTSENAGGRIDDSEHSFTTGYYDDVRLTLKYAIKDLYQAIFGALHESGHAIYNQNLNPDWKWMFLGSKCSSGFGESQARFMENVIGKSPEFWKFYFPRFQDITERKFKDISHQEFLQAINLVKSSRIRVTADEMTYLIHIIIRFEIEKDLFDLKIDVQDIPAIWNDKYEKDLGVEIETNNEGALQDIHWAWGMWGYFPTYALGNLYAAMLNEKMTRDIPEWANHVADGSLEIPVQWLIDNVHRKSNLYDPAEMIKKITGKSLSADPFIKYLEVKYSTLFG